MIRAVEGLMDETNNIFVIFFGVVVIFQLSAFSLTFILMSVNCAIVCSIIFVLGLYLWYYQCLRIFNRFKVFEVPLLIL